jgi:putative ABC transport system permease protein
VAVAVAIDLARVSAARAFDLSTEAVVGRATHRVVGRPEGVDEALYVALKLGGRAQGAAPVVQGYASAETHRGETLQILGIEPSSKVGGSTGVPVPLAVVQPTPKGSRGS